MKHQNIDEYFYNARNIHELETNINNIFNEIKMKELYVKLIFKALV